MLYLSYQQTQTAAEQSLYVKVSPRSYSAIEPTNIAQIAGSDTAIKPYTFDWSATVATLWARVQVSSLLDQPQTVFVLVDNPTLQELDFWVVNELGELINHYAIGSARDLPATSDYSLPRLAFELPAKAHYYITLRAHSQLSDSFPIRVLNSKQMLEYKESSMLLWGAYLGVSLILIMYFLALYRAMKESVFLVYMGFTLVIFITLAVFYGFGFHIWPALVQRQLLAGMGTLMLTSVIAIAYFTRNFVILSGQISKPRSSLFGLIGAMLLFSLLLPSRWILQLAFIVQPLLFLYLWNTARLQRLHQLWRFYYLYAWMPVCIGLPISTLEFLGALETSLLTRNALLLAMFVQLAMMTLSLTDRMKSMEQRRIHQTTHDHFTQLPNRSALSQLLRQVVCQNQQCSLVLVEVRNFLRFLPYVGAKSAAYLILEAAMLIRSKQFSGAELIEAGATGHYVQPFLVRDHVLGLLVRQTAVEDLMCDLFELCDREVVVANIAINIRPVVAAANFPQHSNKADDLVQKAMQALSYAKKEGLKYALYHDQSIQHSELEIRIATDLRKAIQSGQLELYHQPQMNLSDFSIHGSEVLVRWQHPQLGFIPPDIFVSVAEDIGLIHELTSWVLERSFQQQRIILQRGYQHQLSVNISGKDVSHTGFYQLVAALLEKYEIPPQMLTLELTESATVTDIAALKQLMNQFRQLGVHFSIDDFGTGFSSLEALSQLNFTELKIDRAFVRDMLVSERNRIISKATLELANRLAVKTVAEGVESEQVIIMLAEGRCDIGQGYYFSQPRAFEDYLDWIEKKESQS